MTANRVVMFCAVGAQGLRVSDRIFYLAGSRRVFSDSAWVALRKRVTS